MKKKIKTITIPPNGPRNWLTILEALASGKAEVTGLGIFRLALAAGNWPTCACGQLCAGLPRFGGLRSLSNTAPADGWLRHWGRMFCDQIDRCDWAGALQTFRSIETRSTKLLAKMV